MTDTDKQPAMTYPTPEQYEDWKDDAAEMDMSVSEWMQAMVEAGRKKFDAQVDPDESAEQLRRQRNDLKKELERARSRIDELETQLYRGEKATIKEYVQDNPGVKFGEIVQYIIDTAPKRVGQHLDELEGRGVYVEDDEYYPESDG